MKKVALLVVLALVGMAMATGPVQSEDGQAWDTGKCQAQLAETITIEIPQRFALHLTETSWDLNLAEPPAAKEGYSYNDEYPTPPGEGCYLVPKAVKSIEDLQKYAEKGGWFEPIGTYPAIKDYKDPKGYISDDEKGTIICVNHKKLQKFSNHEGWQLLVDVTGPIEKIGYFAMADVLPFGSHSFFYTDHSVTGMQMAAGESTTGGWLDDEIYEAFWFDGSEVAGNYSVTVQFTLTSL